jgi:uncharacterized protein YciI
MRGLLFRGAAMHFLLFYTYVPDVLERRANFRGAHLKHAWAAQQRGELLWFSAPDRTVVERFAAEDPYVKGGLVTKWVVREWTTVVGEAAIKPIRPEA